MNVRLLYAEKNQKYKLHSFEFVFPGTAYWLSCCEIHLSRASAIRLNTDVFGIGPWPMPRVVASNCPNPDSCTPELPRPGAGWLKCEKNRA